MTFFPADFDHTSDIIAMLDLVNINTPDGDFGFILGTDGIFTDVTGKVWYGSQLLQSPNLELVIGGAAPSGSLSLSFFQDPLAPSLVADIKALGLDYIKGRAITFYVQPIRSMAEFSAPTTAPLQWMQRTIRALTFSLSGAQDRTISVSFEAFTENRRGARRILLNTEGHAEIIGTANPSLEFMPTTDFKEEKLFG